MANGLDEMNAPELEEGRDVKVIAKQLPVTISKGWKNFFNIGVWFCPPVIGIIFGIVVLVKKQKARSYFERLQQRIQQAASQVDNYLEQRVVILKNCAKLLDKAIDLDKDTLTQIAAYRGNGKENDEARTEFNDKVEQMNRSIQIAFENYPDLKAHQELEDAMQQNSYLQREITAAREYYNDVVAQWNMAVNTLYIQQLVAAEQGLTTRIPFATSAEIKEQARGEFF